MNVPTGIGLMIVKALEQNGAKVYIVGRRKEVLEKVAKEEAVSIFHTFLLSYLDVPLGTTNAEVTLSSLLNGLDSFRN